MGRLVSSYPDKHEERLALWHTLMASDVITLSITSNFRSKMQPNQIVTNVDWPAIEDIELPLTTEPSRSFLLVAFLFYLRFEDLDSVFQYKALLAFNVVGTPPTRAAQAFLDSIQALPEVLPRGTYTLTAAQGSSPESGRTDRLEHRGE